MNQSDTIAQTWKKLENGSLKNIKNEDEKRNIKIDIYNQVEKELSDRLSNQKNPRATIRRAVNQKIFGYKPNYRKATK
jgi:poly(A) polymerase Pap1